MSTPLSARRKFPWRKFVCFHLTDHSFVTINKYWDRTSKILICIIDGVLNWYFLHIVKERLVKESRLTKYKPLVSFNAKLMVLSVAMDV